MNYLLDTNVCVQLIRRTNQAGQIHRRLNEVADSGGTCFISTFTHFELDWGARRSSRPEEARAHVSDILRTFRAAPFDAVAAERAAAVWATLLDSGTPIGVIDGLIAGVALANDLPLVTHNTREYARVPGLKIEDWQSA